MNGGFCWPFKCDGMWFGSFAWIAFQVKRDEHGVLTVAFAMMD